MIRRHVLKHCETDASHLQCIRMLSAQQAGEEVDNGMDDDGAFQQANPDPDDMVNQPLSTELVSDELGDLFHFNPFPPTQELNRNGVFHTHPDGFEVTMADHDPVLREPSAIIQPHDDVIAEFLVEQNMIEFDPCSEIYDKVCSPITAHPIIA